jgi:hypothetical protein
MADLQAFLAACVPGDVIQITDAVGATFEATVVTVKPLGGADLELQEAGLSSTTYWVHQGTELSLSIRGKGSF